MVFAALKTNSENAELFSLRMKDLLAQNRTDGWIEVMDYCCEQVPFLMKKGRPSEQELKESLVGQLGFDSWESFIFHHGLKINTWRNWRKAYSVVLKHEYLRELKPSRSTIIKTWARLKSEFPDNPAAWNACINGMKVQDEISGINQPSANDTQNTTHDVKHRINYQYVIEKMFREISLKNLEAQVAHYQNETAQLKSRDIKNVQKLNEIHAALDVKRNESLNLQDELTVISKAKENYLILSNFLAVVVALLIFEIYVKPLFWP